MNSRLLVWCIRSILMLAALTGIGWLSAWAFWSGARTPASPAEKHNSPLLAAACLGTVDIAGGPVTLSVQHPGRVTDLLVQENDVVKSGQVLLRVDDREARIGLDQARSAVDIAKIHVDQAMQEKRLLPTRLSQVRANRDSLGHRLEASKQLLLRQRELLQINQVSIREVNAAENQVLELEALTRAAQDKVSEMELSDAELPVRESQSALRMAETRLSQADYQLGLCTLHAPENGTILRVMLRKGEQAGPMSNSAAFLFAPTRSWIVRAEVEQEFIGRVKVGQIARVSDDVLGARAWPGKVQRISQLFSTSRSLPERPSQFRDVPTVECQIALDPPGPDWRIGQRVQVELLNEK